MSNGAGTNCIRPGSLSPSL